MHHALPEFTRSNDACLCKHLFRQNLLAPYRHCEHVRVEKEAEAVANDILQSTTWKITSATQFSVIEQLILMLVVRPLLCLLADFDRPAEHACASVCAPELYTRASVINLLVGLLTARNG
jgi:hypothetical protein